MFLESRKVPSSLLCVYLASALQCYYAIEQWSFYFWLTVDNLALNPWPEYCLNVKWANPNKLAGSAAHHRPAFGYNCYKQTRTWVKNRSSHKQQCGTQWCLGTPGRVFVNSIATCMWATQGLAGWTSKLLWGEEQLREASPNALLHLFRSSLQCYCISKHGREKSICSSRSTASASIQRCCTS